MADQGLPGWLGLTDTNSEFNKHHFAMQQRLAKLRTNVVVKVMAVTAAGAPDQWTVDVQPIVNQVDGAGNPIPHGTVYGIAMLNGSGGNGSIVVKPKVGDFGLMAVGDRDMSSAIAAKGQANPGSRRMHDLSDGIYLGGFGNMNTSAHYFVADENGFTIQGDLTITGAVKASGEVIAQTGTSGGVHLSTHKHTDPQGGTTGSPIAGS